MQSQTQEIADLQKQLSAYAGDTSEETRATIQRLQTSLNEAQENLEETEYERYIEDQKKLLDDLVDEYEAVLNTRLDDIDALLSDMIDMVNESSSEIQATLQEEADKVGYTLSDNMSTIWDTNSTKISDVVTVYGGNIQSALTTTNSVLSTISTNVTSMMNSLDKSASSSTKTATSSSSTTSKSATTATKSSSSSSSSSSKSSSSSSSSSSGWGSWFVYKKDSYPKNKLNISTSIVDRLKYHDIDSAYSQRKVYYNAMGGQSKYGTYTGSAKQNTWMISEMKSHGYAKGGTVGDMIGQAGEDGFILARTGEEVLSLEKIQALGEAFKNIDNVMDNFEQIKRDKVNNMKAHGKEVDVDNINFEVVLPNVENYDDFKREMQHDKNFENMIQDMTINRMFNGSELKKYKYK